MKSLSGRAEWTIKACASHNIRRWCRCGWTWVVSLCRRRNYVKLSPVDSLWIRASRVNSFSRRLPNAMISFWHLMFVWDCKAPHGDVRIHSVACDDAFEFSRTFLGWWTHLCSFVCLFCVVRLMQMFINFYLAHMWQRNKKNSLICADEVKQIERHGETMRNEKIFVVRSRRSLWNELWGFDSDEAYD